MVKSSKLDYATIKKHARELRKNMTDAEKTLWYVLKNRKLSGYKFLRQHPVVYKSDLIQLYYFIADFYCHEKKAIIELDGPVHNLMKKYDEFRDSELENKGLKVLRIKNEELQDLEKVKIKIIKFLDS